MREEQSEPVEPEIEPDEVASETAPPKRPRGWKRFTLPVLAIAVVVLVIVSVIVVRPSSGEKLTGSNAYDLLLGESDLPTGWTVNPWPYYTTSANNTYGSDVNGQHTVKSYASALWDCDPANPMYVGIYYPIQCSLWVFDNSASAHTAILNWTSLDSANGDTRHGYSPTVNGTIGDESYGLAVAAELGVAFREANVVVMMYMGYDQTQESLYYNSVRELMSFAEMQCDKING